MSELPKRVITKATRSYRSAMFRLHGRLHDTVTINTKQGRLSVSTQDQGIGAPLFRERQYEFHSSVRFVQFLKEEGFLPQNGATMFDIGANIGVISTGLLLSNEVQNSVAIEPEPANFDLLSTNAKQNQLSDRMCCLHMAVGDTSSTLTLEISSRNPGDHRIRATPAGSLTERYNETARPSIEVRSLPLAQILELPELKESGMAAPDLIWIDVQGYEGFVFRGAHNTVAEGLPTVSEVWPYGILRAGMPLAEYSDIVKNIWTDYWVYREQRFVRCSVSSFDQLIEEVGLDGAHENVIFTRRT